MKRIISLFALTMAFSASAADQKILNIVNNIENKNYDLILEVDENQVARGLKVFDHTMRDTKEYDMSNLNQGVILKEEQGYKVIVLKSGDFEHDRGGSMDVDYLKNGIVGSRGKMNLEVQFDGKDWVVFSNGSKVKNLKFYPNKVFGKVVGISKIVAD
ncbi:MAG: hypothetical protein OHK0056_10680 [Bacteriovoracaceae bacterium]